MSRILLLSLLFCSLMLLFRTSDTCHAEISQLEYLIHVYRFDWIPIDCIEPLAGEYTHIKGVGSNKISLVIRYPEQGLSGLKIVKHDKLCVAFDGNKPIGATCSGVDALNRCLSEYPQVAIITFISIYDDLDSDAESFLKSHPEYLKNKQYVFMNDTSVRQDGPFLYFPSVGGDSIPKFRSNHLHGGIYFDLSKETDLDLLEKATVGDSRTAFITIRNPLPGFDKRLASFVSRGIKNLSIEYWYDNITIDMEPFSNVELTSLSLLPRKTVYEGEKIVLTPTTVEHPECTPALKHLRLWSRWRSSDVKSMISRCENLSFEFFSLEETEEVVWDDFPTIQHLRIHDYFVPEDKMINEPASRFLKRAISSCEKLQVLYADELLTEGRYKNVKAVGIASCISCRMDLFSLFPSATFAQVELAKLRSTKGTGKVNIKFPGKCRGLILLSHSDIEVTILFGNDVCVYDLFAFLPHPFVFAMKILTVTD